MRRIRVDCDCGGIAHPDAGTIDRLARLQLAVQRDGSELQLVGAQPCLLELLDLCGLAEVLQARPKGLGERFGDPGL
jgi:ABC-type transporter Mla MlaB component